MTATTTVVGAPLWSRQYGATTTGIVSLGFLVAFEAFAVATVMPLIARDLDGLPLYAMAFAAPMALSVLSLAMAVHGPTPGGPARRCSSGWRCLSAASSWPALRRR